MVEKVITPQGKKPIIAFDKSMFILGLLSVLVFISLIQSVSLFKLINNTRSDAVAVNNASTSKSTTKTDSSGSGGGLPGVLKDIPQQVGGC